MKRYFLLLSYDGTNFCGWQNQKNLPTVQGTIESALSVLCRSDQKVLGCGRTDTGVHADVYFAHWDYAHSLEESFLLKINSILPRSVSIQDVFEVDPKYNARYSALERTYHYHIHTRKDPFKRLYSYEYPHHALNLSLMQEAAQLLTNYTEFKPLIKLDRETGKTGCKLVSSSITMTDKYSFLYKVCANRFLHNMVRRIVGSLILIGREKQTIEEFKSALDHQSDLRLIALAPANGLHLVQVTYPFLPSFSDI